jgi:hypothetical protein
LEDLKMFLSTRLVCALVGGAFSLAAQATAPATVPAVRTTGMVGIAEGQTARLNLLNPGDQSAGAGVVCTAQVSFLDNSGIVLKVGALTVIPGRSASLDLRSDTDLQLAVGNRREVRALIALMDVTPAANPATTPFCNVVPTLEIFNTVSGQTLVTLGKTTVVPAVQ